MKKVGDLFEELGFRKDASDGVKRAFVENLVRAAGQTLPAQPAAKAQVKETQLSFNFDALEGREPKTPIPTKKRSAG